MLTFDAGGVDGGHEMTVTGGSEGIIGESYELLMKPVDEPKFFSLIEKPSEK
ncbi:hypothetical protein GCM10027022_01130 [Alpinimonas psychrophila]